MDILLSFVIFNSIRFLPFTALFILSNVVFR